MKRPCTAALSLGLVLSFSTLASADDDELEFAAKLRGSEEVPVPIETRTRGSGSFEVGEDLTRIRYELKIKKASNILGRAGAHSHCAPRGENGPIAAFLAGEHAGGLQGTVRIRATLTDQNVIDVGCGSDVAGLVDAMLAGDTYVNVHSIDHPSGEIRGQTELEDDRDDDDCLRRLLGGDPRRAPGARISASWEPARRSSSTGTPAR